MKISKKIISLLLAAVICFSALPIAMAGDTEEVTEEYATEATVPGDGEEVPGETQTGTEEPPTEVTTEAETTVPDSDTETTTQTTVPTTEEPTTEEPTTEEPTTEEDITEEVPQENKPLQDDDIVADFYVFYDQSDIHGAGHTWIYVENLTDQELKVGAYTLPANEGVSVGTLPEYDGWGIYYNIESYQQGIYGMEDQLSMKDEITLKKLRHVSNFIVSYPNFWDPVFFNCMLFAFFAWDMGSFKILIPLFFPIIGKIQMLIYPHETGTLMKPVTKDKVYRQTGMFGWAELMPYDT